MTTLVGFPLRRVVQLLIVRLPVLGSDVRPRPRYSNGSDKPPSHDELWRVEQAFERILGKVGCSTSRKVPSNPYLQRPIYFRPPYGKYNNLLLSALENRGYKKMFLWSTSHSIPTVCR
jgi:peptidoglycan/xylan/chitin deacetylase (PgdA/CDA1 family)